MLPGSSNTVRLDIATQCLVSPREEPKMADEEKQIEDELVDYEEEDENAAEAKGEDSEATQIKK